MHRGINHRNPHHTTRGGHAACQLSVRRPHAPQPAHTHSVTTLDVARHGVCAACLALGELSASLGLAPLGVARTLHDNLSDVTRPGPAEQGEGARPRTPRDTAPRVSFYFTPPHLGSVTWGVLGA